ncbi:MAG: glutathione S-transferase family protein [Candidatus Binataceae bacterium]
MKARLYQFVTSPFCAKVRKILEYKGLEFETIEVDYIERKELIVASGQMMVPAVTLPGGETIVDSGRIAARLEELYPEPTIFPPTWRGQHLALAGYIDNQIEDALFRVAIPDYLEHFRRLGPDRLAFYRLIKERKYGVGFCDRMVREHEANWEDARKILASFEESVTDRAFILGRIGLADFALYGQLYYLAFTGELKIPPDFPALRAFFGRIDRITAAIEPGAP